MNFRFDAMKATQVAGLFIKKENGPINIMKLVKLIYLLDRLSFQIRGIPVLGGDYYSMKNGPVTSEALDLINSDSLNGATTDWASFITSRSGHEVVLKSDPGTNRLSESEIGLINRLYAQHGGKDQYGIRDWCHSYCPEWHPISSGRKEISVESIMTVLGKEPEEIKQTIRQEQEIELLESILA